MRETTGPTGLIDIDRLTAEDTDARTLGGQASLTYRQRLGGSRSLVAQLQTDASGEDEDQDLISMDRGDPDAVDDLDQAQVREDRALSQTGSLLFTQPLSRRRALQLDVRHTTAWGSQDQSVVDRLGGIPDPNAALSSALDRTTNTTRGGVTLRDNGESHLASVGLDIEHTRLDGEIRDFATAIDRRTTRLLPSATAQVTFPRNQQLTLRYSTESREPTLRQLQPVADNRNPLDVYVGNPALRSEYRHTLSARLFHFDTFSLTNASAAIRATYSPTAISTARTIDDAFRQSRTPINAGGAWQVSGNAAYGTPIRPIRTKISLSASTTFRRQIERINEADNVSDVFRTTLDISVENQRKVGVDVRAGARFTFNNSSYSLSPEFDRRYLGQTVYAEGSAEVGNAWFLKTALDLERVPADVFGTARQLPLWSAEVSRTITGRYRLQLLANDLLDQGLNVQYNATGGILQEERTRSLGRHVLLKLIVDLSEVRR